MLRDICEAKYHFIGGGMREPYMTETGIFFYLECDGTQRGFLVSTEALRLLARRLGYIMDYMNLYRAHEALIHATARAVATDYFGTTVYLDAVYFSITSKAAMRREPQALHR